MRVVILQSNYLPWRGYFDLIHDADYFVFYDEVQYTNRDWRNRNCIYTRNGIQWLTVPVEKGAAHKKISEVRIAGDHWRGTHLKSLLMGYRSAPHFGQLESLIRESHEQRSWESISDLNRFLIKAICERLQIRTKFVDSNELDLSGDRVARLVNIAKQLDATEYISGPAAKDYLAGQEHLFSEENIVLSYKDYSGYPRYRQLREPYEPRVSVVDLFANVPLDSIPKLIWGWREEAETPQLQTPAGSLAQR